MCRRPSGGQDNIGAERSGSQQRGGIKLVQVFVYLPVVVRG